VPPLRCVGDGRYDMFADVPFLLAFGGGLVATVNPCGFAMLPAYLSFFLGLDAGHARGDGGSGRAAGVGQALRVGATVVVGFLLVFGAAWVLVAAGIRAMIAVVPWAALVVGGVVLGLGVWMLSGRPLPIRLPAPGRAADGRSTGAILLFGLGYAIASLSCTLPVFLAVVAGTATRSSLGSGLAVFGVYAVGMALPLLAVTVALALGRDSLVARARGLGRVVNRLAGVLLVVAGLYVVVYWTILLAGVAGGFLDTAIVGVERASSYLTMLIGDRPVLWGVAFAAIVGLGVAANRAVNRSSRREEGAT
jgi:cytochrome c-type biogenesis protein